MQKTSASEDGRQTPLLCAQITASCTLTDSIVEAPVRVPHPLSRVTRLLLRNSVEHTVPVERVIDVFLPAC